MGKRLLVGTAMAGLFITATALIAQAAGRLEQRPRYVDFSRLSARTLQELGLATGSDAVKRTYETGDGEYTTVIGGYSGLYRDEKGNVKPVDNTLVLGDKDALPASSSSLFFRSRKASFVENEGNSAKVRIPMEMSRSRGVTVETEEGTLEFIPSVGSFKHPSVAGKLRWEFIAVNGGV